MELFALAAGLPALPDHDMSFLGLFLQAGIVVKAVMAILAIMSILSWIIICEKLVSSGAKTKRARQFEEAFWSGKIDDSFDAKVGDHPADAQARVYAAMAREWREAKREGRISAPEANALTERAERLGRAAIDREISRSEGGLATLAIIASASPFIGLFGTVWGIMTSFRAIGMAGDANMAVVAPGIAEALFATALGLLAAIPAVMFYNKFSADIGKLTDRLETFSQQLIVRVSRRAMERVS